MATGWGRKTWGASEWGDLSDEIVSVSGISLTSSIGSESVTANADVSVSGISLSSSIGTSVAGTSALVSDPGPVTMSIGVGSTVVGIGVPVTGSVFNTQIGAATVDETILTGEGWGRGEWGEFAWGDNFSVQVTGQSLTSSIGSETAFTDVTVAVSGSQASFTQGSFSLQIDGDVIVLAAEDQLDFTIGSSSLSGDANVTVSGISMTSSQGTTVGGLKTPVNVTGSQASLTQGNITLIQSTNESVTGIAATMTLGQHSEIPAQIVGVSGISMTSSLGEEGPITGDALVTPSGIQLTGSIGSPNITSWNEIDLGVSNTWTVVDLAA